MFPPPPKRLGGFDVIRGLGGVVVPRQEITTLSDILFSVICFVYKPSGGWEGWFRIQNLALS